MSNNLTENYIATSKFDFLGSSSTIYIKSTTHLASTPNQPMFMGKVVDILRIRHPLSWQHVGQTRHKIKITLSKEYHSLMEKREKLSALNQNLRILQLVKPCTYWTFFLVMPYMMKQELIFFFFSSKSLCKSDWIKTPLSCPCHKSKINSPIKPLYVWYIFFLLQHSQQPTSYTTR